MANDYILTDNNEGKILPRMLTLTWVKTNPVSDSQAFDNRLLASESYPNYTLVNNHQKFNTGDSIFFQITSNYDVKDVYLVNETTEAETDLTGAVASKSTAWSTVDSFVSTDYGTLTVYNKTIYTTLLSGTYHLRLELEPDSEDGLQYTSNTFQVGDYSNCPLIEWSHSVTGFRKGIYFSGVEAFQTRIDSRYCEYKSGIDLDLNDSWNKSLTLIDADSKFYAVMELSKLPRYILEKLNCILQVDTKTINEEQYEVENGIEEQLIRDELIVTSVYKGRLIWRKVNYEKYQDFEAEEEVEIPYILINSDDEDYMTINDDDDYAIYIDE